MPATQTLNDLQEARRSLQGLRRDRQDWKRAHEKLAEDLWPCEEFLSKLNPRFDWILDFDEMIQVALLRHKQTFEIDMQAALRDVLADWLELATETLSDIRRLEDEYGSVAGASDLRSRIKLATDILTPDDEFFRGDALAKLRDQALASHRAGLTEPLLNDDL